MSSLERDIIVKLIMQTAEFKGGMQQAKAGLESLKKETIETSKKVDVLEKSSEAAAQDLVQLGKKAKTAGQDAKSSSEDFARLEAKIKALEDKIKALSKDFKDLEAATKKAANSTKTLENAFSTLRKVITAAGIAYAAKQLFDLGAAAVGTAERLNLLRGSIAAIAAANQTVTDSSGKVITGVEKIKIVQQQVQGLFEQIQIDALKTSDTTAGLIEKFQFALQPGVAAGMNLDQVRQVAVMASNAMSALAVPQVQAYSEIRALLTGENLRQSQLAKGLGFVKSEEIVKLAQAGKLFDELKKRMSDFDAAAGLASRGLTGVSSSLQDIGEKLLGVAGEETTKTLAEGFGRVLDSIQNADGSLTPLGESLVQMGRVGGEVLNGLATSFLEMVDVFLAGGIDIANMFKDILIGLKSIGAKMGAYRAVYGPKNMNDTKIHNLEEKLKYPGFTDGVTGFDRKAAQKELNAYKKQQTIYDFQSEKMAADYEGSWTSEIEETIKRLEGRKRTAQNTVPGVTTTLNIPKPGGDTKGARKAAAEAAKKENTRIRDLMAKMSEDTRINDANEGGFTGRIAILDKYIKLLGTGKLAIEEVRKLENEKDTAIIERGKLILKLLQDRKKSEEEIRKMQAESGFKNTADRNEVFLTQLEHGNRIFADLMKRRYDDGRMMANAYYTALANDEIETVKTRHETELSLLEANRREIEQQLKFESNRPAVTPGELAARQRAVVGLNLQIAEIDSKIENLGSNLDTGIAGINLDKEIKIREATERSAKAGFESAIDSVFGTLNLGMASGIAENMKFAFTKAFEASGVGKSQFEALNNSGAGALLGAWVNLVGNIGAHNTNQRDKRVGIFNSLQDELINSGNPEDATRNRIDSRIMGLEKAFKEANTNFLGFGGRELTPAQAAQIEKLRAQLEIEGQKGNLAQRVNTRASDDSRFEKMIDRSGRSEVLINAEIERLEKELNSAEMTFGRMQDIEDKLYSYRKELRDKTAAENQQRFDAEARFAEKNSQKISDSYKKLAANIISSLERIRTEREAAFRADQIDKQVSAIYGKSSSAQNAMLAKLEEAKMRERDILDIGRENSSQENTRSALLATFASNMNISTYNASGKQVAGINGQMMRAGEQGSYMAEAGTFSDDMDLFLRWHRAGVILKNQATGEELTEQDFIKAKSAWEAATAIIETNNAKVPGLRQAVADLKKSADPLSAQIQAGAANTLIDTDFEARKAAAFGNPGLEKQIRLEEIDRQIQAKKEALYQDGVLSDSVNSGTRNQIISNLEKLREAMKANVNNEFTDSNPMPVRVVELPTLYALPDSVYFRQQSNPGLRVDKIEINGSGLDAAQLESVAVSAVLKASQTITREVNRQNTFDNNRITL